MDGLAATAIVVAVLVLALVLVVAVVVIVIVIVIITGGAFALPVRSWGRQPRLEVDERSDEGAVTRGRTSSTCDPARASIS